MNTRHLVTLSVLILVLVSLPGINHGIWLPDEPCVAGVSSSMARSDDFTVPRLNGEPFLEKPPLYYTAGALFGKLLGYDHDISYRLASVLFGILTLVTVFVIVYRRKGVLEAAIASGILAGSWQFFVEMRWIRVDSALVFGVALAMYAYVRLMDKPSPAYSALLGLAAGISFMAKGLVGPVLIASAVITDMICKRDLRIAWRLGPLTAAAFFFVPVLPWIIGLYHNGGWTFIREVIVVNNIMRFMGSPEGAVLGHQHGILYYLYYLPTGFLPWTLVFIPALIASLKDYRNDPYIPWIIGPVILLSISSTKRGVYLLPLYPAAACMMAQWIVSYKSRPWEEIMVRITWAIVIVACFAPLAGIFLGMPLLGIALTLVSSACLYLFTHKEPFAGLKDLSLVIMVCITLSACMTLNYSYLKPQRDLLGFSRQAVDITEDKSLAILGRSEVFDGILPMLTGKTYPVTKDPGTIQASGLYVWLDKHDRVLDAIRQKARVDIMLNRDLGTNRAILADVTLIDTKPVTYLKPDEEVTRLVMQGNIKGENNE